jgi:Tol biopolymer transport system component
MQPANRIQTISGFTLTPDGQNAVFALSDVDEAGNRYSNLFIKRADEVSGGVSRLTSGARFFDSQPFIANDGSNYLVFTSNRGDRAKPDIFRVNLVENRLSGGISRLTNDNRFNFQPTYGDSNRQLFYLSVEPAFPKAEVQISSIRFDGSLPTQLPVMGEQINNTHAEKVFFVKIDSDTKKRQIYSITTDGKLETALLNQEDFKKANCFQPYVSADGQRVLFVSDRTGDDKERPNNDIYVVNFDGTNLQRLTYNESDDTLPMWSPTEEGVVYFLSTRGGATNIWRLKLVSGH